METEAIIQQEESNGEKMGLVVLMLIMAVVLMAESGLMALSLWKAPVLIQLIYDKVTLPESLLFITHLKGLFGFVMMAICCVPALLLMTLTSFLLSKAAKRK